MKGLGTSTKFWRAALALSLGAPFWFDLLAPIAPTADQDMIDAVAFIRRRLGNLFESL
ncbi:MAG TPA: hypothetical protein VJO12_11655 [Stellaceae bacterium]|nr:hypothetical protein [Stellaceae bacterium]